MGNRPKSSLLKGQVSALPARGITEQTCRVFKYRVAKYNGEPVHIAPYFDADGNEVAQKIRNQRKEFWVKGSMKDALGLFGQSVWRDTGRMVVITEGEIDALSVSQAQGNKYPVVSLPSGASSARKAVAKAGSWLAGFEKIVLLFDDDEPGREAAREAARALPPGKAYIGTIPGYKDANEALKDGQGKAIIDAIWGAKAYRPDGLVAVEDLTDQIMAPTEWGIPWWSDRLTKLTYGRRMTELYAIGAGTGVGKTDFFTQQMAFDIETLGETIGVISLEQPVSETGKRIAGKIVGKQFHIPDGDWETEELQDALARMAGKVVLYDHFGETEWDVVKNHIRYMSSVLGIRLIYLDHLTAMADPANEKESIETIMKEMAGLAQEQRIVIHFISHLATPEGKPHEEGGRVMIRHFKGSRSIGFWSYFMFGMERNVQAEDPTEQSTTIFRVLKDRNTGKATGKTIPMLYDTNSGLMAEADERGSNDYGFTNEGEEEDDPPF